MPEGVVYSHPKNIILLTCDAQGVMPPIARLDPDQAIYHFISGYTSKIAGTEIGLGIEPEITFSACFGAPFMVHHPFEYARHAQATEDAASRLPAAGWSTPAGSAAASGSGKRISHPPHPQPAQRRPRGQARGCSVPQDRLFGFEVPLACPEVPEDVLDPSTSWGNKDDYWRRYDALAARYIENFKLFESGCPKEVADAGPKRLKDRPRS